jgi:serine/threonine-protein kinase
MIQAATGAPADPLLGRVIGGKYHLEQQLGAGAMGVVYRAVDAAGLSVAVKVMTAESAQNADLRERFEREAVALLRLKHPNILDVRDYGLDPELQRPYLAMELLQGRTLEDMIVDQPPDPKTGIELATQLLRGLAHAHAHGVLHRDLKTENVFVTWDGQRWVVKLLDFGLVKFEDAQKWNAERNLTMQGMVFGSPAYMSPEQATGGKVDARSDVYSAGVVLFELLTGCWPFEADSLPEMLRAHLLDEVPALASKREGLMVRPELETIVRKALAKKPEERFANAGEMLAAVEALPAPAAWIAGMTHLPPQPIAPAPAVAPPRKKPALSQDAKIILGISLVLASLVGGAGILFLFLLWR